MEDNVLKKMAIRSLALMFTVIAISATCSKYNQIPILANDNSASNNGDSSAFDVANIDVDTNELELLSSMDGKKYQESPEELLSSKYIVINKPTTKEASISLEDIYMERSIKLIISGLKSETLDYNMILRKNNIESFIGKPTTRNNEDTYIDNVNDFAKNITITYDHDLEKEEYSATILIELDTVYAYTLYQDSQNYYINLQRPKDVYDKLIVIDAGHGGNDVGTFPNGMDYLEKDMNLSIILYLKQLFDKEDIKVYYTRLTDTKPYLRPRVRLANDIEADLFISIHCNGSNLLQPHGTEVLYNEKWDSAGFTSKQLAQICLEELTNKIDIRNRGLVSGSEKYIVGHSNVPVALIEVAYMTNPSDLEFLKSSDNRKLVAEGVYNGILRYFEEYGVEK